MSEREEASPRSQLDAARRRIQTLEGRLAAQEEVIQTLREDHAFRVGVIERAAEGVCVCHDVPDHPYVRFTVWNPRMTEITGYTMEEVNERGWYQSVYPDAEIQERARQRMQRMRQGDDLRRERWEITRADGERRLVAISTSVLTARDGCVHVLALMHDFTEEERLQAQARIDELTGVRNRRGFKEDAEVLLKFAARHSHPVTLVYLDVDGLKSVNDSLGHAEGDRLLKALASALLSLSRSSDVVGRLGGDEFALVLPGMNAEDAKALGDRVYGRLLAMMGESGWRTGISMGVVSCTGDVSCVEQMLLAADSAMYAAKRQGGGVAFV